MKCYGGKNWIDLNFIGLGWMATEQEDPEFHTGYRCNKYTPSTEDYWTVVNSEISQLSQKTIVCSLSFFSKLYTHDRGKHPCAW